MYCLIFCCCSGAAAVSIVSVGGVNLFSIIFHGPEIQRQRVKSIEIEREINTYRKREPENFRALNCILNRRQHFPISNVSQCKNVPMNKNCCYFFCCWLYEGGRSSSSNRLSFSNHGQNQQPTKC